MTFFGRNMNSTEGGGIRCCSPDFLKQGLTQLFPVVILEVGYNFFFLVVLVFALNENYSPLLTPIQSEDCHVFG